MAEIEIKNVGPVKEAKLTLKKVNAIMGPQSSGKSTIAKIISHCTWVEKDVATSQSLKRYNNNGESFKNYLEKYHKMNKYFQPDSYISYESDVVKMKYDKEKFVIDWKDQYAYKRSKISYIPSERNLITLPEVEKIKFDKINIRNFLFEWYDVRKNYMKSKELSLLNLGVNYYYNEKADEDYIIHQNGKSYNILLSDASSGLQSITPLLAMIDYLIFGIYNQEETVSYEWEDRKQRVIEILSEELVCKKYFGNNFNKSKEQLNEIAEKLARGDEHLIKLVKNRLNIQEMLFTTHNSQLIIEEPEQNLFPETQRDLIYYLLEKCLDKEREHRLTITTHSPYILYALNNCMMGELVKDKMINASEQEKIKCANSLIDPKCVSIYEIHDGKLKNIQQEDGLISDNYFDTKMKELMDDFYVMLNYYE